MKHRVLSILLALSLAAALAVPALAAGTPFPDVSASHWAAGDIAAAAEAGLFQGDENGLFQPGSTLTRAAFVTVLCRMFGWDDAAPAQPSYTDCAPGDWFYAAAETAAAHGAGAGSGAFRPNDPITRREIAVLLIQALGYESLADEAVSAGLSSPFADVSLSDPDGGAILVAYQIGLTNGVAQGDKLLFQPDQTATRAEAAAMVMRVYRRWTAPLGFLHGFYAFSSYSQLELAEQMDAVSVGWSRLSAGADGAPVVVTDAAGGNEWVFPQGWQEVPAALAAHGVKCNLSVYADAASTYTDAQGAEVRVLEAVLTDPDRRAAAVAAVVDAAAGFDGVTIDFEGLRAPLRDGFSAFAAQLRAALGADKLLYVCVQPDDWYDGYDYRAVGSAADRVILMAHDFDWAVPAGYVGAANTENPSAGLPDVYRAVAAVTDPETGVADPAKVVLAVSFTSVGLNVDEDGRIASTDQASPAPDTLIRRLRQADAVRGWSDELASPYVTYTVEDGSRWLVWYEDARSVSAKAGLARMFGLGGLSLWRLGIIPAWDDAGLDYDVWSALTALG